MTVSVRPAVAGDWPAMSAAFVAAGRAAWPHILPPEALAQLSPPLRWMPGTGPDVLVAEVPGVLTQVGVAGPGVVGFIVLRRSGDADATDETGLVDSFYVHPDAWGQGVGRALLDAGVDLLARRGFREATLWTEVRNERPRAIYLALGWHLDGTERRRTHLGAELVELRHRRTLPRRAAGDGIG